MGERGPVPQPTEVKELNGNPGRRPLKKKKESGSQQRTKIPQCPDHLDEPARRQWHHLVRILRRARTLKEGDYMTLGTLCQAYTTMATAQSNLARAGLLYKASNGNVQPSPFLAIVNQCTRTIIRICREFGLTPMSRARVEAAEAEDPAGPETDTLDGNWARPTS